MNKINKRAFTLIELLVVIVVIGILTTLAVASLQNVRKSARDAKRIADIKQIQTALRLYYNNVGSYPELASITASNSIAYNGIVYMSDFPQAPTPADGDCSSSNNEYIYTPTETNNSSYQISFCLGGQIANLSQGEKCTTPDGILTNSCSIPSSGTCGILLDERNNQSYETVQLGDQCWMAENLNVGEMIINTNNQTVDSDIEKYCWNNEESYCNIEGGLYQWDEAMYYDYQEFNHQGICPDGWHMPSNEEWTELIDYVITNPDYNSDGCNVTDGYIAKALASNYGWQSHTTACAIGNNQETNNSSGFNALPAGYRYWSTGAFDLRGSVAFFWTSSFIYNFPSYNAIYRRFYYDNPWISSPTTFTSWGFPVRCIKNN